MSLPIEPRFYFQLDELGCVINPSAYEKIPEKYCQLVKDVSQEIISNFSEKLNSLLLRGSISSGRAIPFVSDADFVIVLNYAPSIDDRLWLQQKSQQFQQQYPFVSLFDFTSINKTTLLNDDQYFFLRVNLKTYSFCLYGENVLQVLPKVAPGKDFAAQIIRHARKELLDLSSKLRETPYELTYQGNIKPVSFWCIWLMRVLLRSSIALIMIHKPIYSNDISTCSYELCQMFPQYRSLIEKAFLWERSPTNDLLELNEFLSDFLPKYLALAVDLPQE